MRQLSPTSAPSGGVPAGEALKRPRSLLPREHGAYGQLALPLMTALAIARPTAVALGFTSAFVAAFLAHEPALVVAGLRGTRARREDGPRALGWLALAGLVVALSGGAAFARSSSVGRAAVMVPVALAGLLVAFIAAKQERSTAGEITAAAALSGTAFPVAIAGGLPVASALIAWLVWALGLAVVTVAVRGVIAHARRQLDGSLWLRALPAVALAVSAGALAATRLLPLGASLAIAPFCAAAAGLCAYPPPVKQMRVVGWSLVAASVLTAVILIVALRPAGGS
jgi:hypothetical protein